MCVFVHLCVCVQGARRELSVPELRALYRSASEMHRAKEAARAWEEKQVRGTYFSCWNHSVWMLPLAFPSLIPRRVCLFFGRCLF